MYRNKNYLTRTGEFLKRRYAPRGARISFSQAGEDMIMQEFLLRFGITKPFFIDIGAHHPIFGNNTYLFYTKGGQGIIVEPDQLLLNLYRPKRKRDTALHAGAGKIDGKSSFYSFVQSTRNTFSEKQAKEWEAHSGQHPMIFQIPILSLDSIITAHCNGKIPDVISIDAEGYDFEIISGFSWKLRPKLFCIESVKNNARIPQRNQVLYELFLKNGYVRGAETPANTIFIDGKLIQ